MKSHRTLIQACLLGALLLLALPAVVQAQFTYTTNNGAITITGYIGSNDVVTIPSNIEGLPVTGIGNRAFFSSHVVNVLISDSVTNIGRDAFSRCGSLTNVTLGSSVTSIGDSAFGSSPNLMSVCCRGNAPTLAGPNVFHGSPATVYYLPGATGWRPTFGGRPAVLWNPPVPFNYITNNGTITITGYTGSGRSVTIPSAINFVPVTSIGFFAFGYYYSSLTNVTIPTSVTSIGGDAFFFCIGLTSVTIPDSVTNIGDSAFNNCINLTNVTIPTSVTSIPDYAFTGCASLTSITIPSSITGIGRLTFAGCISLTSVTIPSRVVEIGSGAFSSCTSLTNVTIGSSVTSLTGGTFDYCSNLTSITVEPGNLCFSSVSGVLFDLGQTLLLQYPEGKVGGYTIPKSVTNIDGSAFYNCTRLTCITIPNSVVSIGNSAFDSCTGLANVTIGSGVTDIGIYAFSDCKSLTNVSIPNSVTSIWSYVFFYCTSLTNVSIPNSVTSIGSSAFEGCTSLTSITIPDSVNLIGTSAFFYCTGLTSITIPGSVTRIGDAAFFRCESLTNVIMDSSATTISSQVFNYCSKLEGIFFNGNAPAFGGDGTIFDNAPDVIVYYMPGTTGWEAVFAGRPTALWLPAMQTSNPSFGIQTNQFGFNINWASGQTVVVDACTNLANPDWQPVQTNTLTTGSVYFSDPEWTNYSARFYRLRSP